MSKDQLPPTPDRILYEVRRALTAMGVEDRERMLAEVECRLASNRAFPSVWPHRTAEAVRGAVHGLFENRADLILAAVFHRDFAIDPRFSFDTFIGTRSVDAVGRVRALVDTAISCGSAKPAFLLHGESGTGKTHLLLALANEVLRRDPYARVTYLTAETWHSASIAGLRAGVPFALPPEFDMVLIDDLDGVVNKERSKEEFRSFVLQLVSEGTQVVLSATREFGGLGNAESSRLRRPSRDALVLWLQERAKQKNLPLAAGLARTLAASAKNCFELESTLQRYELLSSIGGDLRPEAILGESV